MTISSVNEKPRTMTSPWPLIKWGSSMETLSHVREQVFIETNKQKGV